MTAVVLAAAVSAVGYWWLQTDRADQSRPAEETPPSVDEAVAVSDEPIPELSPVEMLLESARQAMDSEQFVAPEGNSARDLYREALLLEPGNALAAMGLREISSTFVQRAQDALRTGDFEAAGIAIGIAEETDPENPGLELVKQLLLAEAIGALANARIAAIEGDLDRAEELLVQAERYPVVDTGMIESVRARIAQTRLGRQLSDAVAAAEANITAGNLIAPESDNAHTQLLALQRNYGADSRVLASIERLVERLLNRAAFATAAEQFAIAGDLLDAAAEFGVLEPDVTAARTWLQQAVDLASTGGPASRAGTVEAATEPDIDASPDTVAMVGNDTLFTDENILDSNPAGTGTFEAERQPGQIVQFSELAVEHYVAPRFPPRAFETGTSGIVDLQFDVNPDGSTGNIEIVNAEPQDTFVPSAVNAVRQWRFAERDDAVRARVRLRFDPLGPQ